MNLTQLVLLIIVSYSSLSSQDYIRSDELILNDNLEIGSEIINLNKLLKQEKSTSQLVVESNLLFKIVNDTLLVNYIDLEYLSSDTSLIVLKKRLNFEDICESTGSLPAISRLQTQSTILTCSQTLKIVAINENDFIEIPIEIQKINENLIKKRDISLTFTQTVLSLNISSIDSSFVIEPAQVLAQEQDDIIYLKDKILYKLIDLDTNDYFKFNLTQTSGKSIKLSIVFNNEDSLIKAYDSNLIFKLKLDAYLSDNITDLYDLRTNGSQTILVRVTELKKLNLKPLDFEQQIYSISIENNYLNLNDLILQPKLKYFKSNNTEIVFSMFQNDVTNNLEFPFYVDESTGSIRIRKQIWDEEDEYSNKDLNKVFNFGIKATYKRLIESKKATKTNYYYDYMIPAFSKVQITVRKQKFESPIIRSEIISPFVSKYEILNEESSNQTFIFYVNDPFPSQSKLVSFSIDFSKAKTINMNNTNLTWIFDEKTDFTFDSNNNNNNLTLLNKFEFKDQQIYKSRIKLIEKIKNHKKKRVLSELSVEFRIDFDPLLFEKQEYKIYLSQSDLIDQNLIKIKVKDRLRTKLDQQNMDNVLYRLSESGDSDLFEINPANGWLSAKRTLLRKNVYEFEIIAINTDLQKSATSKCKVYVDCSKIGKQEVDTIKFSLFENSPNRTQIGTFRSVCSNLKYSYEFDQNLSVRLCPKDNPFDESNCKLFDLDSNKQKFIDTISNQTKDLKLFTLDAESGYLMTNSLINLNLIFNLIKEDYYFTVFEDLNLVYESNYLTIQLIASIKNDLSLNLKYTIEILVQSVPRLLNFNSNLILSQSDSLETSVEPNQCLFNYKFLTNNNQNDVQKTIAWPSSTLISRFVRIDQNLAHLEAEFKVSECSAKFFISNNGCLTLRYDHLFKNNSLKNSCSKMTLNQKNETDVVLLKSGYYNLEFKLCYYNNNKVSCSQFYNQTLFVSTDLFRNSRIQTNIKSDADRLQLIKIDKNGSFNILKKSTLSVYLIIVLIVIGVVAIIAIVVLIVLFARPKYKSNNVKSPSEKALVLPVKRDIDFKNLELSTDEGNRTRSSSNTPEIASSAATTSSKLTKAEDENEDEVKIQVIDDYIDIGKNYSSMKYGYSNNNFSYAGSFSSIGSSYESNLTDDVLKIKNSPRVENEQGLYSVKNASIQFNHQNEMNTSNAKDYEMYDSGCSNDSNPTKPESLNGNNVYNCILINNYSNSNLNPNQSIQQQQQQQQQLTNPHPKTSSLKKLKKEIALKKAIYSNMVESNMYNNLTNTESVVGSNNHQIEINNKLLYESSSYGYINSKEILLNPDEIIASIV